MRLAFGGRPRPMLILPVAIALLSQHAALGDPAGNPAPSVEVLSYNLEANQDTPELCFVLSASVARRPAAPLESFVVVDPAIPLSATPRNDRLCLTGFSFGNDYTISLKAGLPGIAGQLARDTQFRIDIPNRPPELGFAAPDKFVLPRTGSDGLPIRSVNVPKIDVRIFHVADDNLLLDGSREPLTAEGAAAFDPVRGERVWQGSVDPKGNPNQDTATMLPIDATIGTLKPGLYVATAWPAGLPATGQTLPTQYFMVSDLGLAAYRGAGSLLVAARSLATAAAAPGIDIALVARNNRELGRVRTDGNGFARFDAAALQNRDGNSPAAIRAYGPAGEFAALRLEDAAESAALASQSDIALILLDRGTYRPGESVDILALLRTDQNVAIAKRPIIMTVIRPNGAVFLSQTLSDQGSGSCNVSVTVPETGSAGTWRVEARREGDAGPIGSASFDVDAAAGSQLNVSLNADVAVIDPSQPANITVQAQSPDGQQAGNVPGELRVTISAATSPFPAFPGFSFGAVDETVAPLQLDPIRLATDASGKTGIPLKISLPPKATQPLEATIAARMLDAAGRTIERTIEVPVANHSLLLGVLPAPGAIFPAGQSAHFEIIAVSPDGARQEKPGAGWEILRQDWKPSWSLDGHRFAYRPAVKDTHITGGLIDIPAGSPAMLDAANLPPGRYRIEVFDPNGEAISSARFMVGWAVRNSGDPVDMIAITPTKASYAPGDGLDVFIKPPFESDIVLASADPGIRDPVVQHVPAAGATMHLTLPRDAGIATQLLATAVAPPDAAAPGLTRRAFGRTQIPADPTSRSLDVKLDLPATAMPQRTLSVPVTVAGAGEDQVYIRVALTDERTSGDGLEANSPIDPLIARQASMVATVDNYASVITPSGLSSGGLLDPTPSGGVPSHSADQQPPQPALALYSGIVTLDKSGKGNVLLTVPDYAGKVRIKALAWSANRSGKAEAGLTIRYPLNTTLPLPDFLMPDDRADLTLALDNADGPRGEYRIKIHAEGAVSVQDETEAVVNLAEHEQRTQPVAVQAHGPGDGIIAISVKGPDGMAFEHHIVLKVRPGAPAITRHAVVTLKPGGTLAVDPALTANMRPDGVAVSAAVGAGNDLDLVGIAQELAASTPDSAEQTVAAATAYLAPDALLPTLGLGAAPKEQLARAVEALAVRQDGDGGFSRFAAGQSDNWLTAYAIDFMARAKARGAAVSDVVMGQALDYLALHAEPSVDPAYDVPGSPPTYSQQALATAAYANQVLAANGRLNLFQLRYFSDRFLSQMRSPVGAAFVAAAFANLGEKSTAAAALARGAALPADTLPAEIDGSDLRDQALLNAVMAESGAAAPTSVAAMAAKTASIAAGHRQLSLQEASWMIRAGIAETPLEAKFKIKLGDKTVEQSTALVLPVTGQPLPAIKNLGDMPVHIAMTVSGAPAIGEPKDQAGYEVQRWFFDTSGKSVDPAVLHQGDLIVVVLTGRFTGQGDAHPVLYDPVAAGWTVEAAEIADPAGRYPWLKDLTGASNVTVADGLYMATPRLAGDRHEFRLAYVVRAAVRGQFTLPGTLIEDRIQPMLSARTASGRSKVDPPS